MANKVMDTGLGTFMYYGTLPGTGSTLNIALLQFNASFPSDATLDGAATLAAVLALTNVAECAATNYARQVATSVSASVTSHTATLTSANFLWSNLGGTTNNTLQKAILYYRPTASAVDSACIPLAQYDFSITTDGSSVTATVNASGLITSVSN